MTVTNNLGKPDGEPCTIYCDWDDYNSWRQYADSLTVQVKLLISKSISSGAESDAVKSWAIAATVWRVQLGQWPKCFGLGSSCELALGLVKNTETKSLVAHIQAGVKLVSKYNELFGLSETHEEYAVPPDGLEVAESEGWSLFGGDDSRLLVGAVLTLGVVGLVSAVVLSVK